MSHAEKQFLDNPDPSIEECVHLVWRLESVWVLLWALGHVAEMPWPSSMCDVPKLVAVLGSFEATADLANGAQRRSVGELLDHQDLVRRLHWALRNACRHGLPIPAGLDWSITGDYVAADQCRAAAVVEERHRTLNWLIGYPRLWPNCS